MILNFTKMHNLQNDFIVTDQKLKLSESQIAYLCDRVIGIGADGFIIVSKTKTGIQMQYWNSDGSYAEMCGNALLCSIKFATELGMIEPGEVEVMTDSGKLLASYNPESGQSEAQIGLPSMGDAEDILGESLQSVNIGNPHAIAFRKISLEELKEIGPKIEHHQAFPNKTNVSFVEVVARDKLRVKTWERGSGYTRACGTGMSASAFASKNLNLTDYPVEVVADGGVARIYEDEFGYIRMQTRPQTVFKGQIEIKS